MTKKNITNLNNRLGKEFKRLVSILNANMVYNNCEVLKRLKFMMNKSTLNFAFAKDELPNCIVVEDWARFYKFDAADDYENPSLFVAECLIEEVMNKIELEKAFDEVMNELMEKHQIED